MYTNMHKVNFDCLQFFKMLARHLEMNMILTNEDLLSNVSLGGILTYFGGTEQIEILEFKTWEETLLFPSHIFVVKHYQHCVFLCVSIVFSYTKLLPLPKLKTCDDMILNI